MNSIARDGLDQTVLDLIEYQMQLKSAARACAYPGCWGILRRVIPDRERVAKVSRLNV